MMMPSTASQAAVRARPRIVLTRHGRPDLRLPRRVRPRDWPALVHAYDRAGICPASLPKRPLAQLASQCGLVACSPLRRSVESARLLGGTQETLCDELFREVALPHASWTLPPLHPYVWGTLFRFAWMCGFARNGEDRAGAQRRADAVTHRLVELANERGSVLLVGHGVLNQLIAKNLRARGWQGPRLPGITFWAFAVYSSP